MDLFLVVWFALFFYITGSALVRFVRNENSPILTVPAAIVHMRRKTHHHNNGHSHTWHITFRLDTGEELELKVPRGQYRELAVGCRGMLTYQGTRYKNFTY